jgi:hypothetical protein
MDPGLPVAKDFIRVSSDSLLNRYWPRIKACVEPLSQEEVDWQPPTVSLPSIGDILRRFSDSLFVTIAACSSSTLEHPLVASSGHSGDAGMPKETLISEIEEELGSLTSILNGLPPESLTNSRRIGARESTLMEVITELSSELAGAYGEISQLASTITDYRSSCNC